jgi:monofunctional biosynthetic peptidoglycan transglycosylase
MRPVPFLRRLTRWGARLLLLALAGLVILQRSYCVRVVRLRFRNPGSTAFMRREDGGGVDYRWVPYGRISTTLKQAVIAAEDGNFLSHHGFDWQALREAYDRNRRQGELIRGGSTISQQLAKNLFLSPRRSLLRKAQEAVITAMLELLLDKRRILELYLNVIEWGDGIYGAEAASRHYYGIPAADLDQYRAATLAAMIPSPVYYDRHRRTSFLERRIETIQRWLPVTPVP